MALDPRQIDLIQDSFQKIRANLQPPSAFFYEALFRHAPQYREMFREDLEGQGMRFMSTLGVIVDNLGQPEAVEARFADLGVSHAALGITRAHFPPMEEALIDTLRNELGAGMTEETEAAWRAAYEEVAARIMAKGNIS
ncbi:MAG: globin [Rhodobacteraceae bacterium]|nr:globin [Paracoccaceae bacterium]